MGLSLSEGEEEVPTANFICFQTWPLLPSSLETFLRSVVCIFLSSSLLGEVSQGRDGFSELISLCP